MRRITHMAMVALFVIGLLMTCGDGMVHLFGLDRAAQYTWNFSFVFLIVPLFAWHVVERRMKDIEEG